MAASRIAATRSVERACFGCFREAIRGIRRSGMGLPAMRIANMKDYSYFCSSARPRLIRLEIRSMTTLTSYPFALLLGHLFDEADANSPATSPDFAQVTREEHLRLMQSKTEYRDFYGRLKDYPLAVSRETGRLLYMLARSSRARNIVEF